MPGILLLILKVIGLILLGVLGLFLVLVLLVLFLPVSYRVWVSGDSDDPGQLAYRVKIFGVQVLPKKERNRRFGKERAKKPDKTQNQETSSLPDTAGQTVRTTAEGGQPENPEASKREASKQETSKQKDSKQKTSKQPTLKWKMGSQKARQLNVPDSGNSGSKASKKKEKGASGTDIRSVLEQVRAEFTDEGNRRALRHVCSEIRYLLRHFGPRRLRADLSFSLGDPANTGYVTAALSVCPFPYGKGCHIIPDFEAEQFYLRGWLDISGHVRTVHVLAILLRLLFDRNIRAIIKKVLKQKKKQK